MNSSDHFAGQLIGLGPIPIVDAGMAESAPIGSFVRDETPDLHGRPLLQVRRIAIADLVLPELIDGKLSVEKRRFLPEFTSRIIAGSRPPRVRAVERADGRVRVVDGHRRCLALENAGFPDTEVLVSPAVVHERAGGVTTLTEELLVELGAPAACAAAWLHSQLDSALSDALSRLGLLAVSAEEVAAWNRACNDGATPQAPVGSIRWDVTATSCVRPIYVREGGGEPRLFTAALDDWEDHGPAFVLEPGDRAGTDGSPEYLVAPLNQASQLASSPSPHRASRMSV